MKKLFDYFLSGLMMVIPFFVTIFIVYKLIDWTEGELGGAFETIFGFNFPGIGLVSTIVLITLLGYLLTTLLGKPFFNLMDKFLSGMPYIKIIYSSLKDFSQAFLGEKKKFNEPVMVKMTETGVMKLGFITQHDLSLLNLQDMVAVYFPHSYNFSGNLFLVPRANLTPVEGNPSEIMKFIVTAGVTTLEE